MYKISPIAQTSEVGPWKQEKLMCSIEEAEEEIMTGLGASFSPLCPHDVTDLRGAVTAAIGRRMEAEVDHGAWMESYLFF